MCFCFLFWLHNPLDQSLDDFITINHRMDISCEDASIYINKPFNTGVLCVLVSITIGTSLMLTPVLLPTTDQLKSTLDYTLFSERLITALSTICVVGWMMYFRDSITLRRNDHLTPTNDDSRPLTRTLATFGIGSLVYCIFATACFVEDDDDDAKVLVIITALKYIAHAIFVVCLFVFFLSFKPDRTTFRNILSVHLGFTFLIIVTTWTWLGIAITPMMLIPSYGNETNITRCYHVFPNQTGKNCTVYMAELFCNPFHIEFPTIVILFLISQWLTTISLPRHLLSASHCDFVAWSSTCSSTRFYKPASISLSIVFGLVYTGALIYYQLFNDDEQFYIIIKLTSRVISLLPIVAVTWQLRYWRDSGNFPVSSSETVLILTTCSDVVWFMFRLISSTACCDIDRKGLPFYVYMCYAFLSVVQPVLQTKLFLDLRRKRKPLHVKNLIIFLAVFNFSEWLNRGIDHCSIEQGRQFVFTPFVTAFFGPYITRMILLLILPVMNLFRFHSGMIAVELIQEKNEPRKNVRGSSVRSNSCPDEHSPLV